MAVLGLPFCVSFSLVTVSGATLQLQCTGFLVQWLVLQLSMSTKKCMLQQLWYTAQQLQSLGSVAVVHGLSCSEACGIFLDQKSKLGLLHWQVESLPLSHQGSPIFAFSRGENLYFIVFQAPYPYIDTGKKTW